MVKRKGIGESGKTLKQIKDEGERLLGETGCYAGITKPHQLRDDPVKGELFHSRILSVLISGRETTRMISGSPFVREVAELCLGLYTPEGDNIAQSTGIQIHIRLMGDHIKWMIDRNYEEEVGIEDGDLFITNDPAISNMHPNDIYDIMPIFWEEELVGWVCTVIMEVDIGSVSPSCMPLPNAERATDGLRFCCEKIGSNDHLRRDFEYKIENNLDNPNLFLLDRKGAMAANTRVREEIKSIISEFGLDYYKKATRELIEEERRNQIRRIRQRMVPGRYRNVAPNEFYMADQPVSWLAAKKDTLRLIPIQMDILTSGEVVLDFEGIGEWGWHNFNVPPKAVSGAVSICLVQTLSYDGRANLGSLLPFQIKCPAGSLLNPPEPRLLAFSNSWASCNDTFGTWIGMLGAAHYIRGFREETFNYRLASGWQLYGFDQFGHKRVMIPGGTGFCGPGATGVCDGVDNGGVIITPETDTGNEEVWELFAPYLSLSRRYILYSAGYGRFRSGLSLNRMDLIYGVKQVFAAGVAGCGSRNILPNMGMFGGYPGGRQITALVRYDDLPEMLNRKEPLLHEIIDPANLQNGIKAKVTSFSHMPPPMEVKEGDLLIIASTGAGGLGDPIEREPELVKSDLDNGKVNQEIARNIYCVAAIFNEKSKAWEIDYAVTADLRQAKRKERLARGQPVKQWWRKARKRLMRKDLDSKLAEMYQSSMKMSQSFAGDFREFWALPREFCF